MAGLTLTTKHVARTETIDAGLTILQLPIAKGGFVGVRQDPVSTRSWTLDELISEGFTVHDWDGR